MREKLEVRLEEGEPVKALITKATSHTFKLTDSAAAFFNEHETNLIRISKVRKDTENAPKFYKKPYYQKLKTATQVSASASASI
jgi:hypothetical protein